MNLLIPELYPTQTSFLSHYLSLFLTSDQDPVFLPNSLSYQVLSFHLLHMPILFLLVNEIQASVPLFSLLPPPLFLLKPGHISVCQYLRHAVLATSPPLHPKFVQNHPSASKLFSAVQLKGGFFTKSLQSGWTRAGNPPGLPFPCLASFHVPQLPSDGSSLF